MFQQPYIHTITQRRESASLLTMIGQRNIDVKVSMCESSMFRFLKNIIKTNKYFWKFRHIVDASVWRNYHDDYKSERRNFYSEFVVKNKLTSVFEFGCASGPNLQNIKNNTPQIYLFGYDINKQAVNFAKSVFDAETAFFTNDLKKNVLLHKMKKWNISAFDLSVYDRVLYLLNEDEIKAHFSEFSDLFNFVVIDDFHNEEFPDSNDAYSSKDYVQLLLPFGFHILKIEKSEHYVPDIFFDRSAKRLLFSKKYNEPSVF